VHLLAKGGERSCYIHPENQNLVIKVIHAQGKHNRQNELEYDYYKILVKKNVDFTQIPKCYGWIETNYGKGLVFERITNFDNSPIRTLSFYTKHNLFSNEYDMQLLYDLKDYLFKNSIIFVDASLSNIFCKKISNSDYKLIIFDGLGGRRYGLKFWLYSKIPFLTKYKIKKQWNTLMQNYRYEKSLNIPLKERMTFEN
jgi:hypothetical protein